VLTVEGLYKTRGVLDPVPVEIAGRLVANQGLLQEITARF
jgi:hypothetical protein